MRVGSVCGALLVFLSLPSLVNGQEVASLAYQPNEASVLLAAARSPGAAQDTVRTGSDDPYRVGSSSVVLGAVVGGIIGGSVVAIHTVADNSSDPVVWAAAAAAPIVGGLIGAGVGLIFR